MDESAWIAYQKLVKKAEGIKESITELYGAYNTKTVFSAKRDGLISDDEWSLLRRNCPYN